ncbi:MAG: hypothetical protein K0Q43_666 [Ramlibacter sp.]|jgi:hypothetical protein|nr:hypothetical protein [Ramlibacter sp.]
MSVPDLSAIDTNAEKIVPAIGREAVDVYRFLSAEFARGSVSENYVFQFTYRSFYRLDHAGLTPQFKLRYFELLEAARPSPHVDLRQIARELYDLPTLRGHNSLQFSFVSKIANSVNPEYPIYDSEVARVFRFKPPSSSLPLSARLNQYMSFYEKLQQIYGEILQGGFLQRPREIFRTVYAAPANIVPDTKVLDFIFWSAGRLSFALEPL